MSVEVQILNPEVLRNLYHNHGQFACECYNTSEKHAEKVGKACEESGHMSGSRCEYIKFRILGIDRGTAEQCLRHEVGVSVPVEYQDHYSFADYAELVKTIPADQIVKNMASFRYIDKNGFYWATPANVMRYPDVKARYNALMRYINVEREAIKEMLIDHGVQPNKANEDANLVLPRATTTSFVIGFTPEALIHWMQKRLCKRSQEFITEIACKMRYEVELINPEFAKELTPHCEHLLWCPEGKHSCGRYPTKDKLIKLIQAGRNAVTANASTISE